MGAMLGLLIIIGLIVVWWKYTDMTTEETLAKYKKDGEEYTIAGKYISGLSNVLSGKDAFITVCNNRIYPLIDKEKEIYYDKIYSAKIVGKDYIQEKYSMGKLICLGALALGTDKKTTTIYTNYLELEYEDTDFGRVTITMELTENSQQKGVDFVNRIQNIKNGNLETVAQ